MQAFLIPVLRPSKSTVLCFKDSRIHIGSVNPKVSEYRAPSARDGKDNEELRMQN